ncbi:hypothetical protein [Nocardia sp. IFM 10818]
MTSSETARSVQPIGTHVTWALALIAGAGVVQFAAVCAAGA